MDHLGLVFVTLASVTAIVAACRRRAGGTRACAPAQQLAHGLGREPVGSAGLGRGRLWQVARAVSQDNPSESRQRLERRAWLLEFQEQGGVLANAQNVYAELGLDDRFGDLDFREALGWWRDGWVALRARRKQEAKQRWATRARARQAPCPLDAASFRKALLLTAGSAPHAAMEPALRSLLLKANTSPELLSFIARDASFTRELAVGPLRILSAKYQLLENTEESNDVCLEAGLFVLGCCDNGDPVVVDVESASVGFIDHRELSENAPIPDPRALVVDTGLGIGAFFLAAARHEQTFPVDAAEAKPFAGRFAERFPIR